MSRLWVIFSLFDNYAISPNFHSYFTRYFLGFAREREDYRWSFSMYYRANTLVCGFIYVYCLCLSLFSFSHWSFIILKVGYNEHSGLLRGRSQPPHSHEGVRQGPLGCPLLRYIKVMKVRQGPLWCPLLRYIKVMKVWQGPLGYPLLREI